MVDFDANLSLEDLHVPPTYLSYVHDRLSYLPSDISDKVRPSEHHRPVTKKYYIGREIGDIAFSRTLK